MPYADIGDVKIYYEIYGSEYELLSSGIRKKPTIVAIHGGPGIDHNYYDVPFLEDAAKFAQVIFIDQRGNGRSIDKNSDHWNLRQWAEDIYQFCNALSLDKPFIHGVSMGGWVALLYASLYSQQAAGLLLTDTEAYLDVDAVIKAFEAKGGKEIKEIVEKYFYHSSPEVIQEYFSKCIPLCSNNPVPAAWIERTIMTPEVNDYFKRNELTKFNLMEEIKKITLPVLYITNTTNPLHLYDSAKKAADAMVNAQVEFIPIENCGLVAMDAKEKTLQEFHTFLQKNI